ncbi:unnamed protein product [Schistosoma margrebowiei]|uniref:Uncharacterized protein n=1 Tax=Schistosoma margrebowiei TaxID=48269 RepID=A0A183N1M7_9TREM|nr:unnamed protein product [Schistosoma margrebowiei]
MSELNIFCAHLCILEQDNSKCCVNPKQLLAIVVEHLPDDVRAHGTLDSFSAFPFESYKGQIKDSVRSGFAVARQAVQSYAGKMSFRDRLQLSCLTNTSPMSANDASNKQVIMFKNSKITSFEPDNVVVVKRQPGLVTDNWAVLKCKVVNEFASEPKHVGGAIADQWQWLLGYQLTIKKHRCGALTNRFLSSAVNEKDVGKLYDIATQGYFHDVRDKTIKCNRRKQDQLLNRAVDETFTQSMRSHLSSSRKSRLDFRWTINFEKGKQFIRGVTQKLRKTFGLKDVEIQAHQMVKRVSVLGCGSWGTAIVKVVADNVASSGEFHSKVYWYVRDEEHVNQSLTTCVNKDHTDPIYLSKLKLPANIIASFDIRKVVESADIIMVAYPPFYIIWLVNHVKEFVKKNAYFVSFCKASLKKDLHRFLSHLVSCLYISPVLYGTFLLCSL